MTTTDSHAVYFQLILFKILKNFFDFSAIILTYLVQSFVHNKNERFLPMLVKDLNPKKTKKIL